MSRICVLLPVLLILAGCATGSQQRTARAPNWSVGEDTSSSPLKAPSQTLGAQPPVQSIPGSEQKGSLKKMETWWATQTWVPLARWCESNGLPAPVLLTASPVPKYQLATSNGNFQFSTGSRVAHWQGTEVRLGFGPQWIDRQPFVHGLDLRKTLVPLIAKSASFSSNPLPVLVLDAGHGGEDGGAKSAVESSWEKQFTLDWARRVQALLITNGWQVFLTRSNDQEIALSNRVSFAEQHRADLFLSLHFNSAGTNASQAGLETYCLTPRGMRSTITRDYYDDAAAEYPNNAFDEKNFQLAVRLHRALLEVNGLADRGVRRARFPGVLRGQQRPAILIEGGYLSNPGEARLIAQGAYRQKLAEAVARGLMGLMETQKMESTAFGKGDVIHLIE